MKDDEQVFSVVALLEHHLTFIVEAELQLLRNRSQLSLGQLLLEAEEVEVQKEGDDVLLNFLGIVIGSLVLVTLQHANKPFQVWLYLVTHLEHEVIKFVIFE